MSNRKTEGYTGSSGKLDKGKAVVTPKWNKIEHRMFCQITENWRGVPLRSLEIMVNLIGQTTTRTGLRSEAEPDTNHYEVGLKVSDAELAHVWVGST